MQRGFNFDNTAPFAWDDYGMGFARDAQGRLLLAGVAETGTGHCVGLMRFSPDGAPDPGFGSNGGICHETEYAIAFSSFDIVPLTDGGMFFAGRLSGNDDASIFICRVDALGQLVENFGGELTGCRMLSGIDWEFSDAPSLVVSDDAVIVIATHDAGTHYVPMVARFDRTSGIPLPFGNAPMVSLLSPDDEHSVLVGDAILRADGKIIVAGSISDDGSGDDLMIAAFDPQTGALDGSFAGTGLVSLDISEIPDAFDFATSVALLNGKLLVAGRYETAQAEGIAVVRADAETGLLDDSQGDAVVRYDPCADVQDGCVLRVRRATITESGKIAIGGNIGYGGEGGYMFAARLLPDGTPDGTFGSPQGIRHLDAIATAATVAQGMAVQGERIVLGGWGFRTDTVLVQPQNEFQQVIHSEFALVRLGDGWVFKDQFEDQP